MDLSKLDTRAASENGTWLHLRSPLDNSLLYADDEEKKKPSRIKLLGADSDTLQRYGQRLLDEQRRAARTDGAEFKSSEEQEEEIITLLCEATIGIENLSIGDKPVACTKLSVRSMYVRFPWIAEQAIRRVRDRAAILKN